MTTPSTDYFSVVKDIESISYSELVELIGSIEADVELAVLHIEDPNPYTQDLINLFEKTWEVTSELIDALFAEENRCTFSLGDLFDDLKDAADLMTAFSSLVCHTVAKTNFEDMVLCLYRSEVETLEGIGVDVDVDSYAEGCVDELTGVDIRCGCLGLVTLYILQ